MRIPLFPLMAGVEDICVIVALFGELKSQREEETVIDRKTYGMVYDYNLYLYDGSILNYVWHHFCYFIDAGRL